MEDGAKRIGLAIGLREIAVVIVGGTLEAAIWPQMEDIPHWLRNLHILIAAPLLLSLLVRTQFGWLKWVQSLLGLAYLTTIGYILAYSKDLQDWISKNIILSFPRYGWLIGFAAVIAISATIGLLLKSITNAQDLKSALDEITDLKKQLTTADSVPPIPDTSEAAQLERTAALLASAPRVRVDYVKTGQKGALLFKTDKPSIVRFVRPLVSRERYESEHDFSLIPGPPLVIDPSGVAESKIYGLRQTGSPDVRSLIDILRTSTRRSVESVVIEYDDDHGNSFSRRFDLTRNQDDSITWVPDPSITLSGHEITPEAAPSDLAELRHEVYLATKFQETYEAWQTCSRQLETENQRLLKLRTSYSNVLQAAKVSLLVQDAEKLWDEYNLL